MNVTLCSAFRNSMSYLQRYFDQASSLNAALLAQGHDLYLVIGEGDSTDDTQQALLDYMESPDLDVVLVDVAHGGPEYGSLVHAERFRQLAAVWNVLFGYIPPKADAVLVIESDLIWEPATMLALLDDLEHVGAVSPMVMLKREGFPPDYFYDTWAFWRNGVQIRPMPPYFDGLDDDSDLHEVDSAGSCMAMLGDVARRVTWPEEDVFRGLCRQVREGGDHIYLDTRLKVTHE
jgi:hypothetical protein